MNPCVMGSEAREVRGSEAVSANHALITQLSRNNHPINLLCSRFVAVLFMVFMVGIGNVWGTDYAVVADWRTAGVNNLTPAIGSTGDVVTFSPITKGGTLSSTTASSSGKSLTGLYINNNYSSSGGDFIDIRVPAGYRIKSIDSIYVSHTGTFSGRLTVNCVRC